MYLLQACIVYILLLKLDVRDLGYYTLCKFNGMRELSPQDMEAHYIEHDVAKCVCSSGVVGHFYAFRWKIRNAFM